MDGIDPEIVGILLARCSYREGTVAERLKKVRAVAKDRQRRAYADPFLELEIAKAAKDVRRAVKATERDA